MATGQNTMRSCLLLLSTLLVTCGAPDSARDTTVHVVFGNHLDIGFNNIEPLIGYDNNVLNKYFNEYLPQAASVAKAMHHHSPHGDRYIYTTHSYLLSLFLDCLPGMDLQCPNATTRDTVIDAIRTGAITWHAHPHNAQYELFDASLLEFSFDLTHDLDRQFGLKRKHTVILRDVPGLTRASIPIFVSKGIKALSVGVNAGSAPPGVPKDTPFIWRDEASDTQILAFWHPGGYGGMRGDLALDPKEQCIQAPGLQHVLCTSWRNDNSGPPENVTEPLLIFDLLRQEWGGHSGSDGGGGSSKRRTQVFASSFDAFVDKVLKVLPSLNVPVVTGEIGDTWVFGVQSDPLKTANFRALSRLRAACIKQPTCPSDTPEFYNFSRLLLKVPEHTWGVDIKKTLHDFQDYSNTHLHDCLPPHLRPTWAHGYSSSSSAGSISKSVDSVSSKPHSAESSASSGMDSSGGVRASADNERVRGRDKSFDVDAPCLNYGHCLKAWSRQAAYVDWALQALPQDHRVVQAYTADLEARQQLAAVSPEQLLQGKLPVQTHPRPVLPQASKDSVSLASSAAASNSKSTLHHPSASPSSETAGSSAAGLQDGSLSHETMGQAGMQRGLQMWEQQQQQLLQLDDQLDNQDPLVSSKTSTAPAAAPAATATSLVPPPAGAAATAPAAESVQDPASADAAGMLHTRSVAVTGSGVHQYWCGSWRFEVDEPLGGLTSLVKFYGDGSTAGTDWARGSSSSTSSSSSSSSSTTTTSSSSPSSSSTSSKSPSSSTSSSRKGGGVLGQLMYSAYCESSYDDVWEHYAWQNPMPWWFPLDFGKVNSSRAWDHEEHVAAKLVGLYEAFSAAGLQQLALRFSLPHHLVREVGAPETQWTLITCPTPGQTHQSHPDPSSSSSSSSGGGGSGSSVSSNTVTTTSSSTTTSITTATSSSGSSTTTMTTTSMTSSSSTTTTSSSTGSKHPDTTHEAVTDNVDDGLQITAVWQGKTPTRIPEALWFSFKPEPSAVDSSSWRLHKLGSSIHPHKVVLNGSRSMHAISDQGVSVSSADGNEVLQISSWDTALVSPGHPTPFPQGITQPDMSQGVHFNLVNNVWGTNYIMWVPYSTEDRSMAFRFILDAKQRHVPHVVPVDMS